MIAPAAAQMLAAGVGVLAGLGVAALTHSLAASIARPAEPRRAWLESGIAALAGAAAGIAAGLAGGGLPGAIGAGAAAAAALSAGALDLRAGRVADLTSLIVAAGGLAAARRLDASLHLIDQAVGAALAAAVLLLAAWYVRLRRGRRGLGDGDILLAGACGVWTGWAGVGLALLAAVAITLGVAFARRSGAGARIPFAPGLAGGFALMFVVGAL